ncbi:hydroxyphenylacetyl-CoA thioesterase PaaI [Pseudonocardia xinjiangensis]
MSDNIRGDGREGVTVTERASEDVAARTAEAMERADAAGRGAGVRLLDVGPGRARVGMAVAERHVNGHGICHGGYLFLLADAALAYASNSYGTSAVASGADIAFLRPVPLGAELVAEAVERARTGRSGLYDVTIRSGELVVAELRGRTRQVPGLPPPV